MSKTVKFITMSAVLIALGVLFSMIMPRWVFTPMIAWVPAVHVPIFIACFISPSMAILVSIGTTLGFATTGAPPQLVARVATHLIFVVALAFYIKKYGMPKKIWHVAILGVAINIIHGIGEAVAMHLIFFSQMANPFTAIYLPLVLWMTVFGFSDFALAYLLYRRPVIKKLILNYENANNK